MKYDEQAFVEAVENFNYEKSDKEATLGAVQKDLKGYLQPLIEFVSNQVNLGHLASAELDISDAETRIKLQTSIINLPVDYGKQIAKIMVGDGSVAVNVYMIIQNPFVTHSKLRIDELTSSDNLSTKPNEYVEQFVVWVDKMFKQIEENKKADEEKSKEKTKK